MKRITFRFRDAESQWKWKTQHCTMESVDECLKMYGLGFDRDCEWEILEIEEIDDNEIWGCLCCRF